MAIVEMWDNLPWWWTTLITTSLAIALVIAVVVPAMVFGATRVENKKKQDKIKAAQKLAAKADQQEEDGDEEIEKEPWAPKVAVYEWKEASSVNGCPWNFEGCDSVKDVLEKMWRSPLDKRLQEAVAELEKRVKNVQVAKCTVPLEGEGGVYFCAIYTLHTGGQIFGGAPLDQAVGVELGEVPLDGEQSEGLRRRKGMEIQSRSKSCSEAQELPLVCLAPFYRVHDGVGVLLTERHLPLLMSSPDERIVGSTFYVYPVRALERVGTRPHLIRFARVDKNCVACADGRLENPRVVYLEYPGDATEDDECPLDFACDTICNIAGRKVVGPQNH
eukprot:gnl/TRDRNA2_/TRDRNA2_51797_c0_seq1.p1 gnl/TRDRNA2_/TRDRNA2_51797_c0~~gnl/TRDRNA2_/TRDRNA2_51797_c0_seq1.p1  ORF type:complete len:354 (-),score=65.86 gnl/TRDRNA2_/TRDRNA2_51797_c0_seq1:88-1080(-)